MTISADRRGWGRGWPANRASDMVTVRAARSGAALLVHRKIGPLLKFILDNIESRGHLFDYGPQDVNDDWGYANRSIRGTNVPSNHSWGLAVDMDAQDYPQGQRRRIPPAWVTDVFKMFRFDNGAPWAHPDPMHYEFNGTPAEADWLVHSLAAHHVDGTPPPTPPSAPPSPPTPGSLEELRLALFYCKQIVLGDGLGNPPDAVKFVQTALNRLEGRGIPVDGIWGPVTRQGVIDLQKISNTNELGRVGPLTWALLYP